MPKNTQSGNWSNKPQGPGGGHRSDGPRGGGYRGGGQGGGKPNHPPMQAMPSPYNFVAVEDKVAKADAPERISHDVPFKDGLSGWIDLEIEATTPIYTRAAGDFKDYRAKGFVDDCEAIIGRGNSQPSPDGNWRNCAGFMSFTDCYRLPDGRPAIPGTSMRGSIRNLIEMLTNSRLGPVNERRYAVRDLQNRPLYTDWMSEVRGGAFVPKVKAGWLETEGDNWFIRPCEFARVEQTDLENFLANGTQLGGKASLSSKYGKVPNSKAPTCWQIDPAKDHKHSIDPKTRKPKLLHYRKATPVKAGGAEGTLVLTGQPSRRDDFPPPGKSRGKHMEFVFFAESTTHLPIVDPRHEKRRNLKNDFLETHTDEQGELTEAWKYWKPKLNDGKRVPVFYLAYKSETEVGPDKDTVSIDTPGAHLHAFGLAMMFRLAYRHTLREAIPKSHRDAPAEGDMDFAEAIFGFQREGGEGLRGRVAFGPCVAGRDAKQLPPVVTVLSSPKPTYYPNYMEQPFDATNGNRLALGNAYATLMDHEKQRRLRGWKYYPAHADGPAPSPPLPPLKDERGRSYTTATAFRPLDIGTKFSGRLRFHNLRPSELGALVWALTWGGNDQLRHRLGMAKPLGYGCAKIRILGGRVVPNDPAAAASDLDHPGDTPFVLDQAMNAFATAFADRLNSGDIQHDLLGMANPSHGRELRYPTLKPRNEFADAKKPGVLLVLPRWRTLDGKPPGKPRVDKGELPQQDRVGGGGKGGGGWPPRGNRPTPYQSPAAPTAKHSVGQVVECEVVPGKTGRRKLQIVGGKMHESGGLAVEAQASASELPEIGGRIQMKIAAAGAGGYQFAFPD